jgi:hypothetical protein
MLHDPHDVRVAFNSTLLGLAAGITNVCPPNYLERKPQFPTLSPNFASSIYPWEHNPALEVAFDQFRLQMLEILLVIEHFV